MSSIKEIKKTHLPEAYYNFSVKDFLASKKLRVEGFRKDKVQGVECAKVTLRIIEDKDGKMDKETQGFTPYNKNKLFTFRIDNTDDEIFEMTMQELENSKGHHFEIDVDHAKEVYFYRQNILTIIGDEFTVLETKEDTQETKWGERPLSNIKLYKTFDFKRFIQETRPKMQGLHTEKGKHYAMFNTFLDNGDCVVFAIHVDNVDELPSEFLTMKIDVNNDVQDYEFNYLTSSHYGTRWTFYFKSLTLRSGVIGYDKYQLGTTENKEADNDSNNYRSQSVPNQI